MQSKLEDSVEFVCYMRYIIGTYDNKYCDILSFEYFIPGSYM
jgi:hypothetical protein